jgi:pyruvate dehydrogenase E2 component (dihydrolipoamide acetyltransferase)
MDVRLPRLGEGADSGTVASIFVKEGEEIKKDQPILELESDKAVATIPAPEAGVVSKIYVKEGEEIKVGQAIIALSSNGGAAPAAETGKPAESQEPAARAETPPAPPIEAKAGEEPARAHTPPAGIPPPASPTMRKLARDLGIDLSRVRGSEHGGRIVMEDLRKYIEQLQQLAFQRTPSATAPPAAAAPARPVPVSVDFSKWGTIKKEKLTTLRRAISNKMSESWTTVPHVTQFDEADITDLLKLRKKHLASYKKKKANLTLTPLILTALIAILKKHPKFNASLDEATGEIVFKSYYHIGIAVDTEQGLIVPVIRDVDKKSLLDLSIELQDLAERTRQRKVSLDEMQGGTFTISNQGGIGGAHFTPIINKPEVAILGLGRGVEKAAVRKNKIGKRTLLPLGLSYDHRVIDGADAARFITEFVQLLEGMKETDVKLGKHS